MFQEGNHTVNQGNYHQILEWIKLRTQNYQINLEGWVLAMIHDLPPIPDEAAANSLDRWVKRYLPPRNMRGMWQELQQIDNPGDRQGLPTDKQPGCSHNT
ncbi:MAG: hypothetical protein HQL63_13705 [Magnetococcales bacterium]|nr:hypothetical protein [Magnetococcales bacterium]MBF0322784.1 hypothetical protein [Magnetococcales bacterium]